ncbi:hypothetical protein cyc_09092 [Cyclospora cayetanensis]|uniref:Uncharacterized protein n=1 Tax=Cyclospora cayetanensis TaxID=88456 RepID=A0A1D3D6E1_9EIME|nr:hypothetical protein cyc_09092 [Cyclospora cayetanensis]
MGGEFMVALRPEGQSCLLLLQNGRGHLYGKTGRPLFRVRCSSKWKSATSVLAASACTAPCGVSGALLEPHGDPYSLPLGVDMLQGELENEHYFAVPPQEKQRLLLLRSRPFDVSLYGSADADRCSAHAALAALPAESSFSWPPQGSLFPPEDGQRGSQKSHQREQQRHLPVLHLPAGMLSKGLTLLECILCPYTSANMQHFSTCYATDQEKAAANAAAATAPAAAGGGSTAESPLWKVLFVVDVLFLGGLMLGHCEFECRHFFLKCRIEEKPHMFAPLQLLPFVEASSSHLQTLAAGRVNVLGASRFPSVRCVFLNVAYLPQPIRLPAGRLCVSTQIGTPHWRDTSFGPVLERRTHLS